MSPFCCNSFPQHEKAFLYFPCAICMLLSILFTVPKETNVFLVMFLTYIGDFLSGPLGWQVYSNQKLSPVCGFDSPVANLEGLPH